MSFEYAWYIQLRKWSAFFSRCVLAHPPLVGKGAFILSMLHIHICSIAGGPPWSPETGAGWHPGQRAGEGHIWSCARTREDDMADNAVDQIKIQQWWLMPRWAVVETEVPDCSRKPRGGNGCVWACHRKARKLRSFSPACPESWILREVKSEESRARRDPNSCFVKRVWKRNRTKSDASTPRLFSRLPTMSALQRLAERLFQRAGPCLGDSRRGEGGYYQSQDESEASCCSEWLTWGIMWIKAAGTVSVWT